MASSLSVFLLLAVATIQVAFASYRPYGCDPPHSIGYGGYKPYYSYGRQYPVGSKITFYCDKGYKLYGSSWTVCKWDKKPYWTHPSPICKPIGCPPLKHPSYGKVKIVGHGLSAVAHYSCDYGYELYGPPKRKCQYGGIWYGKIPICKPIRKNCPTLYNPKYGSVRVAGYGPDSLAYYKCEYGYKLYGPKTLKCLYDGSWNGKSPICKPIRKNCHTLYNPKYGSVRVAGYGPDSLAYYKCEYGYELYGPKTLKCLYNGSWNGKIPICKPKRRGCPKPYGPRYGKVKVIGYGQGAVAYYSCNYGYQLYGHPSRKCQYDGSWYGKIPVCRIVKKKY